MRIFVTGATGYVGGSVAVRLVEAGHEVRGLTRSPEKTDALSRLGIEPVVGSLDDADLLADEARRADAVINAADSDHRGAVASLILALNGSGKRLLHSSGSSIVGDDARGDSVSERVFTEEDLDPDSSWEPEPDKAPRVAIDRLVRSAARKAGVHSTVICNTLIYGHGRGPGRDSVQIPALVRQARSSGVTRHVGAGRNVWSTVHIDDVADLYVRALEHAPAGSFYFAENGEASFADITAAIARALGQGRPEPWDVESAIREWGYEPAVYALGSNSRVRSLRARQDLGWAPTHDSVLDWTDAELVAAGSAG